MNKQEIKDRQQERYKRGHDAEEAFALAFKTKNPEGLLKRATKQQDMFDHIDWFAGEHSYDVKSLKKRRAKDNTVDSTIVWIEFKNVRGNLGWLYGKAQRIAFELEDEFIIVNREDLRKVAESLTIKKYVTSPEPYHLYGRTFTHQQEIEKGYRCQDVMTFLYLSDIEEIIVDRIAKVKEI